MADTNRLSFAYASTMNTETNLVTHRRSPLSGVSVASGEYLASFPAEPPLHVPDVRSPHTQTAEAAARATEIDRVTQTTIIAPGAGTPAA